MPAPVGAANFSEMARGPGTVRGPAVGEVPSSVGLSVIKPDDSDHWHHMIIQVRASAICTGIFHDHRHHHCVSAFKVCPGQCSTLRAKLSTVPYDPGPAPAMIGTPADRQSRLPAGRSCEVLTPASQQSHQAS